MNRWEDEKSVLALMALVKHYSDLYDPGFILSEMERATALVDGEVEIPVSTSMKPIHKPKKDYLYLLEILELVIAY
jgi:hypothetical protein